MRTTLGFILLVLPLCSCDTLPPSKSTQAAATADAIAHAPRKYTVEVASDPPGAAIEVNGEYQGMAPCYATVTGTYDGKLTNAVVIRALPNRQGDYVQKNFFGYLQDVPRRIYFNMSLAPVPTEIDVKVH